MPTFNEDVIVNGKTVSQRYYGNASGLRYATSKYLKNIDAFVKITATFEFSTGVGSGFILSADGYIGTNAHVVADSDNIDQQTGKIKHAEKIFASITNVNGVSGDNRILECEIVGIDGKGDLALIRVKNNVLTSHKFLSWSTPSKIFIGDPCLVVGNPIGLDFQSLCFGVIRDPVYTRSSLVEGIFYSNPIYGGNSGGPILDKHGLLIGVTSFGSDDQNSGGSTNQRVAEHVLTEMKNTGTDYVKGYMGLTYDVVTAFQLEDINGDLLTEQVQGVQVSTVVAGGPAANAGLVANDIIIEIDGTKIGAGKGLVPPTSITWFKDPNDVISVKYYSPIGDPTNKITVNVTLGAFPGSLDVPLNPTI